MRWPTRVYIGFQGWLTDWLTAYPFPTTTIAPFAACPSAAALTPFPCARLLFGQYNNFIPFRLSHDSCRQFNHSPRFNDTRKEKDGSSSSYSDFGSFGGTLFAYTLRHFYRRINMPMMRIVIETPPVTGRHLLPSSSEVVGKNDSSYFASSEMPLGSK